MAVVDCQSTCWPTARVCLVCLSTYKILQAMPMTLWHLITVFFVNHGFVAWPYQIWLLHVSLSLWCLPYLASKSLELCQLCLTKNQLSQISSKRTMPTHPANLNVGKQAQYQRKTTDDCEHLCQKNKRFSCPFKLPSKETLACSGVPYCQAFNVHNCFLGVQTLFKAERRRLFGCHTTNFTPLLLRWFNTFATWTPSIQMSTNYMMICV